MLNRHLLSTLSKVVFALLALGWALAQTHAPAAAPDLSSVQPTLEQLMEVRQALTGFEDVSAAEAAGYARFGECMDGPQGSQGVHYSSGALIGDPSLDALTPELLMYEARPDGSLRLVGAEYIVFQAAWHEAGHAAVPTLLGREFHLNTTLLDEPFYALHLWVWQHNPSGLFANWNPLVTCG